jgi:dehydratase
MQITRSFLRKASLVGAGSALMIAGATGALVAGAAPAFAGAAVSNTYSCSADGVTAPSAYSFSSTAPATVTVGGSYTDAISEGVVAVPATETELGQTVTLTSETDILNVFTAPTGTTISGTPTLSGGSVAGGTPTIATSGSTVTVTIPGPVDGGTSFTAPTVNITLKVTAAVGATIGDAFPTVTPTANIVFAGTPISASTACTPAATPATYDATSVVAATTTTVAPTTTTTKAAAPTTTTTKGGSTPTPVGAIGGLIVAALVGAGLFAGDRMRRRRLLHS